MELQRLRLFGDQVALSWAVVAGRVVHVAGMVGAPIDFSVATLAPFTFPAGIEAQMRQAYRNVGWILDRVGSSLADVADQTMFFTGDAAEARAANGVVRRDVFGQAPPASAMVGVSHLFHPDCRLELKVTAYLAQ